MYSKLALLSLKNLKFNFFRIFFIFLGLISISVILYFFLALSLGIKKNLIDQYLETIPVNEIIVTRKNFMLNVPLLKNFSFSGSSDITQEIISKISEIKGVKKIYPVQNISFPVSIYIDLFGYNFQSDLAISGIPSELLEEDHIKLKGEFKYELTDNPQTPIPALVSYSIIDLYNSNFAEANKLPKLSYEAIIGRHFTLVFGYSSFGAIKKMQRIRCKIVGLSKRAELLGLTIPIETVDKLNKWFDDKYESKYSTLYIKTDKISDIIPITNQIKNLGLNAYSLQEIVDKINTVSFGIISLVIIVLSSISIAVIFNIFNYYLTHLKSQETEIRILKLIGFSNNNIRFIYLCQSLIISIFSAIFSIIITRILIYYLDNFISKKLFEFTNIKLSLFFLTYNIDILVFSASVIITVFTVFSALKQIKLN